MSSLRSIAKGRAICAEAVHITSAQLVAQAHPLPASLDLDVERARERTGGPELHEGAKIAHRHSGDRAHHVAVAEPELNDRRSLSRRANAEPVDGSVDYLVGQERTEHALELAREYGRIQRAADLETQISPPDGTRPLHRLAEIERDLMALLFEFGLRPAERCAIAQSVDAEASEVARAVEKDRERLNRAVVEHKAAVQRDRNALEVRGAAVSERERAVEEAEREGVRRQHAVAEAQRGVDAQMLKIEEEREALEEREFAILEWEDESETKMKKLQAKLDATEDSLRQRDRALSDAEKALSARASELDDRSRMILEREKKFENKLKELAALDRVTKGLHAQASERLAAASEPYQRAGKVKATLEQAKRNRERTAHAPPPKRETTEVRDANSSAEASGSIQARCASSTRSPWVLSSYYCVRKTDILPLMQRCGISPAEWGQPLQPPKDQELENLIRGFVASQQGQRSS